MKKNYLYLFSLTILFLFTVNGIIAQNASLTVFDEILFYDGYAGLVDEEDLYEPIPPEVLRHSNSNYAIKLTDAQLDAFGNKMTAEVTLKAACDNYDRIAHVYLAFVDKGASTYNPGDVDRIEIARFITPFMNKNIQPTETPFAFTMDNVAEIFHDTELRANFDIWVELGIFGVPYAAQTQVAGCSGRIDTFYGTLVFNSETDSGQTFSDPNFIEILACNASLNNYNATDVPGETTKIINFTLDQTVTDVSLFLITSNHGANSGGEEYNRRDHFVYLNDELIYKYIPGGKSCEPYRQYNTQGNGIYSSSPRTNRMWLSFNNWCPGDVIPNREVYLGTLEAGQHTIKLDVPDAVFANQEGNIPVSMYLQNRISSQKICKDPTEFEIIEAASMSVDLDWVENGNAVEWEILYGRTNLYNQEEIVDANNNGNTGATVLNLMDNTYYDFFVRSKCNMDQTSNWVGPIRTRTLLSTESKDFFGFSFYPNPVSGTLNLRATKNIDSIDITDISGKSILSKQINDVASQIILTNLANGIYFMKVNMEGQSTVFKFVKK